MLNDFEKAIVRIYHQQGGIIGAGFLTVDRQIVTCAHVISSSFGLLDIPLEAPLEDIHLDFPLIRPAHALTARVTGWQPELDVALLQIREELPPQVYATSLFRFQEIADHEFHVYGFPEGRDYGLWSFGRILGPNAKGYIQMESETAHIVRQGFSGSLVWDATKRQIVGIITEADRNARETQTAYFLPVNAIIESFPHLGNTHGHEENQLQYACFMSYPNDVGIQGQLVREFAEAIYDALSVELGGLLDESIFFDREHIHGSNGIAQAICGSACFLMIFTPKYFNVRTPLCTLEYKAMLELEASRLRAISQVPQDISFIIPVRPYSRDVLPMNVIGNRRDYDFREMTLAGNLRSHPRYGPLIRELAEHIFKCYRLIKDNDELTQARCSEFRLPAVDQIRDLLESATSKRISRFPIR